MYNQDTELNLLIELFKQLDDRVVIDVGAERGSFVREFLRYGASRIVAVEPYPPNADELRRQFEHMPQVQILELAVGERDEYATLHIVHEKGGQNDSSYHSLVPVAETPLLEAAGSIRVQCRSLASLVAEGVLPSHVGILKIDAERADFAILRGMGILSSAVVMAEFWDDLPGTVGATPYTLGEMATFMRERGYTNFAVIKRHDEFEVVELNNAHTRAGDWGNIIFIHDTIFPRVSTLIGELAGRIHNALVDKALMFSTECHNRLKVIEEQSAALEQQLAIIHRLETNEKTLLAQLSQSQKR